LRDGSAIGRVLSLICVVLLSGCLTSSFHQREATWRHCDSGLVVPDLAQEGWERFRLRGAELAFQKNGEGVIAVRVVCDGRERPLRWAGRDLWLGIPREDLVVREREVGGRSAIETAGRAEGAVVRAVVVEGDPCLVDFAHVHPVGSAVNGALDGLLERVRFGEEP
jgi:hypothetical protein